MKITDRQLFLKYALPCARTLVKRGHLSDEHVDEVMEAVAGNREPPEGFEDNFKVAVAACTLLARRNNKKEIDSEIIRRYFLFEHDYIIDRRYAEKLDFDPEACRTYPGKVLEMEDGTIRVKTPKGIHPIKKDFIPDVVSGDLVVVHWDHMVEKIDHNLAKKILRQKKIKNFLIL